MSATSIDLPTNLRPETRERIDRLCMAAWNGRISPEAFRGLVLSTLREQDRDTRHACAEAVHANHPQYPSTEVCAAIMQCRRNCMNAHAI